MADHTGYPESETKQDLSANNVGESGNLLHNHKRKRDSLDHDAVAGRPAPGDSGRGSIYRRVSPGSADSAPSGAQDISDQATAAFLSAHNASGTTDMEHPTNNTDFMNALAQHTGDHGLHQNGGAAETAGAALHYSMTVPTATELSFQTNPSSGESERQLGGSYGISDHGVQQHHGLPDFGLDALKSGSHQPQATADSHSPSNATPQKPAVGSEEWHKIRRDNHKEVERRRRETINEGINELAKIVPGCEKNKGSILQRAVQFITQLKENETANIEKWTLEKLLTEQAITELSSSCEKFKAEMNRAWEECEIWKRACQANGIVPDEYKNQADASSQPPRTQNGES